MRGRYWEHEGVGQLERAVVFPEFGGGALGDVRRERLDDDYRHSRRSFYSDPFG